MLDRQAERLFVQHLVAVALADPGQCFAVALQAVEVGVAANPEIMVAGHERTGAADIGERGQASLEPVAIDPAQVAGEQHQVVGTGQRP